MLCCLFASITSAQDSIRINILQDRFDMRSDLMGDQIHSEVESLLRARYTVDIQSIEIGTGDAILSDLQRAYQDDAAIVIGAGFRVCNLLAQLENYAKPTILTVVIDHELQGIPLTAEGTSGKENLTYIQSPFDIGRDIKTLYSLKPFDTLGILVDESVIQSPFNFTSYLDQVLSFADVSYRLIPPGEDQIWNIEDIPADVDAGFIFPTLDESRSADMSEVLRKMALRGIPVFSLLSTPGIDLGAYAAYETEASIARIPRRVALNVLKILEGQESQALKVGMEAFSDNLIINMQVVRMTKHYPSWDMLAKAVLINVTDSDPTARQLTLPVAIAEALESNLTLSIAQKETSIVEKDVDLAKTAYLPQIDASTTSLFLDKNTVERSFGSKGYINWTANASLNQIILSEPTMANIAIQKLLLVSQEQSLRLNELDVVLNVADAYLGILQSEELVKLRNENVNRTRKNFDIARAKEDVGYSGISDVFRWESELAGDNIELNSAQATLRQARYHLNAQLNRPIKEEFQLQEIVLDDRLLLALDERLIAFIDNPGDLAFFADFMVEEALNNLPEMKQIEAALAAQERSLLSRSRALYTPSLALSAQYDYPLGISGYPDGVMPVPSQQTYNAAIGLQIPVFTGNSRRLQIQQSKLGVQQLKDQRADLRLKLELQVRSSMEVAGASYSNLQLSRQSATSAEKNFAITQDAYRQGLLNVTSLIDAQNTLLQTQINATNAEYVFVSDFLAVERAVGHYQFLALPQEQDAFLQRLIQFMSNK